MKHLQLVFKTFLWMIVITSLSHCGSNDPSPVSSDLEDLPVDEGGAHTPYVLGSTSAEFGYYMYTPSGYDDGNHEYPLLIFLHGKGERGDGSNNASILNKVLSIGPPRMIKDKKWNPKYPMLVVSPQFHIDEGNLNNWGGGDAEYLKRFIGHVVSKYRVNEKRIYLTGLSHGGNGVYDYITNVSDSESYIACAVPVAGWAANKNFDKCRNTPIWIFNGQNDKNVTENFYTKYNTQLPAPKYPTKLTLFTDVGHNAWDKTYSGSGIGSATNASYDPYDMLVFDWMFQYERED